MNYGSPTKRPIYNGRKRGTAPAYSCRRTEFGELEADTSEPETGRDRLVFGNAIPKQAQEILVHSTFASAFCPQQQIGLLKCLQPLASRPLSAAKMSGNLPTSGSLEQDGRR